MEAQRHRQPQIYTTKLFKGSASHKLCLQPHLSPLEAAGAETVKERAWGPLAWPSRAHQGFSGETLWVNITCVQGLISLK